MGKNEEHNYVRTGFEAHREDGPVETGWVCRDCGYHRLEGDLWNSTVRDIFLDSVARDLGIRLSPPDCPPAESWLGMARLLQMLLDLKDRRDRLERAASDADQQLNNWTDGLREAIGEGSDTDLLFEELGLGDRDNYPEPLDAFIQEGMLPFSGREEALELEPGQFRNLN